MIELISNFLSEQLAKYQLVEKDKSQKSNQVINGSYLGKNTIVSQSLTINGQAILEDKVIIKEKIIVNGSLKAKDVTFESDLTSNGTTFLSDSKINGNTFLRGPITLLNSVFKKTVSVLGNTADFKNCHINSLVIQKLPSKNIVNKIHLQNSTIAGDIVFESGIGKVYVDGTSIIQGKIIGGERIKT